MFLLLSPLYCFAYTYPSLGVSIQRENSKPTCTTHMVIPRLCSTHMSIFIPQHLTPCSICFSHDKLFVAPSMSKTITFKPVSLEQTSLISAVLSSPWNILTNPSRLQSTHHSDQAALPLRWHSYLSGLISITSVLQLNLPAYLISTNSAPQLLENTVGQFLSPSLGLHQLKHHHLVAK